MEQPFTRLSWSSLAACFALGGLLVAQQPPLEVVDVLDGLDPVELVAGREVPGLDSHAAMHRGYRYLFASPQNLATFRKSPERYEPAVGGTCARMGAGGPGNPALFTVFEGRIYLFSSDNCRKHFAAAPQKYIEPLITRDAPSTELRAKGQAIVDRALQALGGAARIDGLTGYVLERGVLRGTAQGRQVIPERVTVLFPDARRLESRTPQGAMLAAATADDMFMAISMGPRSKLMRWHEAPRTAVAKDMSRRILLDLIGLLHQRRSPGAVVTAIETAPVDPSVDSVRITVRDVQAVLTVRRDSGLPATMTYPARNRDGIFGSLTRSFSDYRSISGLQVPFTVDGSFDSEKSAEDSHTLTSWSPNPPITRTEMMREPVTPQAQQ